MKINENRTKKIVKLENDKKIIKEKRIGKLLKLIC